MPKKKGTNRNRKNQEKNNSKVQKEHKNLALLKRQGLNLSEIGDGSVTVDLPLTTRTQRSAPARQTRTDDRPTSRRDVSQMGKVPRKTRPIQDDVDARLDKAQIDADLAAEQEEFDAQNEDFDADLNAYLFTDQEQAEQQAEVERQAEEARKAKEEAEQKAEAARKAKEEEDRQAEEARKAKEEAEQKAEAARKAKEEEDRQAEEARKAKEEAEQKAEAARIAKEQADKTALQQAIAQRTSMDWPLLKPQQQTAIVETAYKATILTEDDRQKKLKNFRLQSKKSGATQKDLDAQNKLEDYIDNLSITAVEQVIPQVQTLAIQARAAIRQARIAQDRALLVTYINGLNTPADNANVKAILLDAVGQLGFADNTIGGEIKKAHTVDDIRQAAFRWNKMNERVGGLQLISNMHIPGGVNGDLTWKDRGKNWERTKNLMAKVGNLSNNIHLHTTGGWQVSKSKPKPKD